MQLGCGRVAWTVELAIHLCIDVALAPLDEWKALLASSLWAESHRNEGRGRSTLLIEWECWGARAAVFDWEIPKRSAHHQLKFFFTEVIGRVSSINTLQTVIIAFFKSNGDWVAWFRRLFLTGSDNAHLVIPVGILTLDANLWAFYNCCHVCESAL